ncbi:helix-turn-helix domain-containing protein [Mycobacterium sp. NPDC004974]
MSAHDPAADGLRARFRREEEALHAEGFPTVADAMELLGVARNTVNRMIGDGRLHAVRREHRWVTRREWIEEIPPCGLVRRQPTEGGQAERHRAAAQWRREHGWLSVVEAAELLGITPEALRTRIRRGKQQTVRAGADIPTPGAWLIRVEDLVRRVA